ncbi:MAG: integral rane protein [Firmicutes bacterium]|nr:integral rane protein [Bacillota bacterium]
MSLAAGLAWYLALLVVPHQNPYFAPLAVVITFQATVADTVAKAWYRIAGIAGGVAVCLLISHGLHVGAVTVGLAVLVGVALSTALHLDPQITSQVGVTVVMVLASSSTPHYAEYRIFESLLGAVVGLVVNALVMPPNGVPLAEKRILAIADLLAASLLNLSHAAQSARRASVQPIAREIEVRMRSAFQALRAAEASTKLNPFLQTGRARLSQLAVALGELEKVGIQVRGIARGLHDLAPGIDCCQAGLDDALKDTAACVVAFRRAVANPSDETFQLVAVAVAEARMSQVDCLSYLKETASLTELRDLGAILADLDRILTEVCVDLRNHRGRVVVDHLIAYGYD